MREYRPNMDREAQSPGGPAPNMHSGPRNEGPPGRRDGFAPPREGPNRSSREGGVFNPYEENKSSSNFSPWAPEGQFSSRSRDAEDAPSQLAGNGRGASGGGSSGSRNPRRDGRRRPPSPESPPRHEDTQIGKGISEFLKRGVAQAAPRKEAERTEMLPSKDGGFIATVQQGFQGIFGHQPTSKEEVLRMRGPMPAPEYEAVPGDDIDQRVQYYARQIPPNLGEWLKIYRLSKGEYQFGDDTVRMNWQSSIGPPKEQTPEGSIVREVFVFVVSKDFDEMDGQVPSEPLPFYMRHCANVAYDLQFGSAMTKVPESSRLSFAEERGTLLKDSDADSKYNAMLLANEQAKKREHAAMEWRKQKSRIDEDDGYGENGHRDRPDQNRDRTDQKVQRTRSNLVVPQDGDSSPDRRSAGRSRSKEAPVERRRNRAPEPPREEPSAEQLVDGGLPPLPPLLPPWGEGGSFLMPPDVGFPVGGSFLSVNNGSFLMPPGGGQAGYGQGPSSHGGSFLQPQTGFAQSNAGSFLMQPGGGSFLSVGHGSFLMTGGAYGAHGAPGGPGAPPPAQMSGGFPRTGSGVAVGLTQQFTQPMMVPFGR